MALSGNLSEFSVLETLQVIALQQKTGTLYVQSEKKRHGLHFRDGRLIGCQPQSPADPDAFLETLTGLGQIGRSEERRIRMLAADSGVDLWRQIGNSVKLEAETLEETRGLVIQGVLDRILLWDKGSFEFDAGPVPPASGPLWNVETAMLESMRRLDESADLKSSGFPLTATVELTGSPEQQPEEEEENPIPAYLERAVLSRLTKKKTLQELIEQLAVAEYDIVTSIRSLRDRGIVRVDARGPGGSVTQILIEQPMRLRNPALAAVLLLFLVGTAFTGLAVHRVTAIHSLPRAEAAQSLRQEVRLDTAILQGLEIYNQREGRYPISLGELITSNIWPAARGDMLADQPYECGPDGVSYVWRDRASDRIQPLAETTSSK